MGLLDNTTAAEYYQGGNAGNYQFVTMDNIISAFMVAYVGEDKLISKIDRTDVQFHAMRAIQEMSYDVFRSIKTQEFDVPPSLTMMLPQDYVNYVKLVRVSGDGIERTLYPTGKTSNPFRPQVNSKKELIFDLKGGLLPSGNLLQNPSFLGGMDPWISNANYSNNGTETIIEPTYNELSASGGFGDPQMGWFHDYPSNSIKAYQIPGYRDFSQKNVPIISGESYKLSFTISDYSNVYGSASLTWYAIDEKGDYVYASDPVTANGTYSKTFVAGSSGSASYTPNILFFRNTNPGSSANLTLDDISLVRVGGEDVSKTWKNYSDQTEIDVYSDSNVDADIDYRGRRYGLDPQHAQSNGTFFIDYQRGYIHFGSTLSGKTVTLKYVSDGLGTDSEMVVHKFCEDACYKYIAHAILSTRSNIPEYIVNRYKKDKFAATRKAKIRLSNIKIEEFTQVLKGLGKPIK